MLNNDYLKGYISALDNVAAFCEAASDNIEPENKLVYNQVQLFIVQVKENYKQLVKDLNENQSKKTT